MSPALVPRAPTPAQASRFAGLWVLFALICLAMLELLAADSGGLFDLVLSGYKVTELLSEKPYLAIAFDWLVALSALATSQAIATGRRDLKRGAGAFAVLLMLMLAVMGRRGILVVVLLSQAWLALQAGWLRRPARLVLPGVLAFLGLNWLGLVRGESYEGMADLGGVLIEKTGELARSGELAGGLFYTLTHGNFVVPFETLPQIMRHLSHTQEFWLGLSIPRSLLLLVPGALLPDRPLPLANWYMAEFYGGAAMNEGRQFFFLSEAYLNFGWLGALAWGGLVAWMVHRLTWPAHREMSAPALALRALFFGSLLSFVASDTTGFLVAFFKGPALLPLVFLAADHFAGRRHG